MYIVLLLPPHTHEIRVKLSLFSALLSEDIILDTCVVLIPGHLTQGNNLNRVTVTQRVIMKLVGYILLIYVSLDLIDAIFLSIPPYFNCWNEI